MSWSRPGWLSEAGAKVDAGRRQRMEARQALRRVMGPEHRCGQCGVAPLPRKPAPGQESFGNMVVLERETSGAHHYGGTESCARGWLCPVCSVPISMRRAAEVTVATARWQQGIDVDPDTGERCGEEGTVLFVTFTVPHGDSQENPLAMLLTAMLKGWSHMVSSSRWGVWKERHELAHWVRSGEITVGWSGWHPHIHALFYLRKWPNELQIGHLEAELWRMWEIGLKAYGITRQLGVEAGVEVKQVTDHRDMGGYISKWAIGHEVIDPGTLKNGKGGTSIPAMGLLDEIAVYGPDIHRARAEDPFAGWLCARWAEYVDATKGMHQFRSSRGWRKALIPDMKELTAEEAVAWGERLRVEDQHLIAREIAAQPELFDAEPVGAADELVDDDQADDETADEPPAHGPVLAMSYSVWGTVFRRLEHAHRSPHTAIIMSCVTRGPLQTAIDLASMCPEFNARIWITPDGAVAICDQARDESWERYDPRHHDRHCDAA